MTHRLRVPVRTLQLALPLLASLIAKAGTAQAQTYPAAWVPSDHWSVAEARRLDRLGLAPSGFDGARRTLSQQEIGAVLDTAASRLASQRDAAPGLVERVEAERRWFREEFARRGVVPALAGSSISAGYASRENPYRTGWGYTDGYAGGADWEPPAPAPDTSRGVAGVVVQWSPLGALAARAALTGGTDGETRIEELYAAGRVGPLGVWAGRRAPGYGPGASGSLVLSGTTALTGGGFGTVRGVRLPWVLGALGPLSFDVAGAAFDTEHSFADVAFLATRVAIRPHPRLRLGVSRGAIFGGDGNTSVSAIDVLYLLIGKHAGEGSELDNQVVALDVELRAPTDRWLPLSAYLEWGFEDTAGAFHHEPGILAGVEAPSLPGIPGLALGVERVSIATSCCKNPIWYRHSHFIDGWTVDGRPLGHSLGGEGTETAVFARLELPRAGVRAEGAAFARLRGSQNLYSPDPGDGTQPSLEGRSRGVWFGVDVRLSEFVTASAAASLEQGGDWRQSAVTVALRGHP